MIHIVTYPKRLFDRMVKNNWYKETDYFLSIGESRVLEGDEPAVPDSLNFMRLGFDDVVMDMLGVKAINMDQAKMIVSFANTIQDDTTVHIHCGAGVSRSTASAKAISEILEAKGLQIDHKRLGESYHPNPTVYKLVMEAYEAQHFTS